MWRSWARTKRPLIICREKLVVVDVGKLPVAMDTLVSSGNAEKIPDKVGRLQKIGACTVCKATAQS